MRVLEAVEPEHERVVIVVGDARMLVCEGRPRAVVHAEYSTVRTPFTNLYAPAPLELLFPSLHHHRRLYARRGRPRYG